MTTKQMRRTSLKPGYWFVNLAALGAEPDWQVQVAPQGESNRLFGYEQQEFMAKQYKAAA